MNNEYEVKSEEVLKIIENYRDKLNISRFYLKFDDTYNKKYFLRIIFKCDYKRYNYENVNDGEITVDFTKEKNIIKLGNWVSNSGLVFNSLQKIKLMIEMIEKLQKIEYMKLPEFKEYVALKDKKKELEEKKAKLEEELTKQKEAIENKLKELEQGGEIND